MFRLHEILILLFSLSEMMLTVSVKPYIVQTIRKQCLHSGCNGLEDDRVHQSEHTSGLHTDVDNSSKVNAEKPDSLSNHSRETTDGERVRAGSDRDVGESGGVEAKSGTYLMIDIVGCFAPWTILGPLCGAWSDKHGRKFPLLITPLCHVISVVFYLLGVHYPDSLLAMVITGSLFRGLTGQQAMFSMILYSMAADTSSANERSVRYASLTAFRDMGLCLGALIGGILLDTVGVSYTMVTSSATQTLITLLIVFALSETFQPSKQTSSRTDKASCLQASANCVRHLCARCGCGYVRTSDEKVLMDEASMGLLIKKKEEEGSVGAAQGNETAGVGRTQVKVAIITMSFLGQSLWACQRELIVQSVTVPPLSWPDSWFGYLSAAYNGGSGLALLLMVPCLMRHLPSTVDADVVVLVIALVGSAVCSLWAGLAIQAVSSWQVFVAYIFGALGPSSNAALRSMMSRCVGSESQSKALAVQSVLENIARVLGPILHTAIFVATLNISTSFVYYVMAGEAVLYVPLVLVITKRLKKLN